MGMCLYRLKENLCIEQGFELTMLTEHLLSRKTALKVQDFEGKSPPGTIECVKATSGSFPDISQSLLEVFSFPVSRAHLPYGLPGTFLFLTLSTPNDNCPPWPLSNHHLATINPYNVSWGNWIDFTSPDLTTICSVMDGARGICTLHL